MTYTLLTYEQNDGVAVITLNNPTKLNPLAVTLQKELRTALAAASADTTVRALLLTATGKGFCVGADLSAMSASQTSDTQPKKSLGNWTADVMEDLTNPLIADFRKLPFPVVVAVNGAAAGAGAGLALAGDVVIAAQSAYFLLPFMTKLGIVPDAGASWFLSRYAGPARARAATLLGDRISAEQAAQWGLIWACVDDATLLENAMATAKQLAATPAYAAMEVRHLFDAAAVNDLPAQLDYERDRQRELIDRPEFAEGVRAFMERRNPVFTK